MPFAFRLKVFVLNFMLLNPQPWRPKPLLTQKEQHRQDKNKFLQSVLEDQLLRSLEGLDSEEYLIHNFFD